MKIPRTLAYPSLTNGDLIPLTNEQRAAKKDAEGVWRYLRAIGAPKQAYKQYLAAEYGERVPWARRVAPTVLARLHLTEEGAS